MNIDDLKRDLVSTEVGNERAEAIGWNAAIDYLASRGYLATQQPADAIETAPKDAVDELEKAREIFENWITVNGYYSFLKYKSFGGNYLREEVSLRWDGFKAGYYARAEQKVVGE